MKNLLLTTFVFIAVDGIIAQNLDPLTARYEPCQQPRGSYSTNRKDGFVPGLFTVTSNLPGATWNRDGSLAFKKIVCAHEDSRTSGGSVVIPWAQFDKRDGQGGGHFDWDFVDEQMAPWVARGQVVNLLVWPAVQKRDQCFPNGASATPDYIMNATNMSYQCPDGSAQGGTSEGVPLPMFWKPEVHLKYIQGLKQFVAHYQDHPNVNYFRFGIGVGAESYPGNGATTHNNYCMSTFVNLFEGDTYNEKAVNAYDTWKNFSAWITRAFRRFNSTKPIVVSINNFSTLQGIDETDFPRMIAEEATKYYEDPSYGVEYPKLGLGVQGATTNDIDLWNSGKRCYADWCAIFDRAKDLGVPLQLQTPLQSGVNGRPGPSQSFQECKTSRKNNGRFGCTNTGNLAELIDFALSVGVNSFELYPYEWQIANDKSWSNDPPELNWYNIYGQQYSDALYKASNKELVADAPTLTPAPPINSPTSGPTPTSGMPTNALPTGTAPTPTSGPGPTPAAPAGGSDSSPSSPIELLSSGSSQSRSLMMVTVLLSVLYLTIFI